MSTIDARTMPMDQLRQLIESGQPVDVTMEETVEQPRDENGRFVTAETVEETEAPVETEEAVVPVTVEREIDLGDGSGIQVFRGTGATEVEAYAALADEFAKAQANATKKIRELSRPAPPEPVVETTPENDFLLAQRIMDTPRAAIRDILKEEFGLTPAEIKAKLATADQMARAQEQDRIARQFMAANPDYNADPKNGRRLARQLEIEGLPETVESLQKVYNDLKADGLITPKPTEAAPVIRSRSSGLSTRSSLPPPPPRAEDLSKLTLEQLKERAGGYQNPYQR